MLEFLVRIVSSLGPAFSGWAANRVLSTGGTPTSAAEPIATADLAEHALSIYDGIQDPFPAVMVGAPSGGVAHLASALGVPFLWQHFLTGFRDHRHADDICTYAAHG